MINKRISYILLLLITFSPLILFSISDYFDGVNNNNFENISNDSILFSEVISEHTCELNKKNVRVLKENFNEEGTLYFLKQNISVIPEYEAIVCIGKVIQTREFFDYINVYYGTNPIFSFLFILLASLAIMLFCNTLRIKQIHLYVLLFIFSCLYQIYFQEIFYLANIFVRLIPFILLNIFLKKSSTDLMEYDSIDEIQPNNIHNSVLGKVGTNISSYIFLVIACVISYVSGKNILRDNYIFNDVATNLLTSSKMINYDMANFQASWNHHTNFVPQIFTFSSILDPENIIDGFYLLHSLLLLPFSIILYKLLLKYNFSKWNSVFLSIIFVFEYSSNPILNRFLGTYINILILIFALNYLNNKKIINLFLYIFFSCLQFFNLESYSVSIFVVFSLLVILEKDRFSFLYKSFIFVISSLFLIYYPIFLTGELEVLLKTNYQFHLFNTKTLSSTGLEKLLNLYNGLSYPNNHGLSQYFLLNIFSTIYIFKNYRKAYNNKNIQDLLLFTLFIGEFLHLLITGPRFNHYGTVLLLPSFLIFLTFLKRIELKQELSIKKIAATNLLILVVFLSPASYTQLKERVFQENYFPTPLSITKTGLNIEPEKEQIYEIIKNDIQTELILTWIDPADWYWVHFEANTLPSTRFVHWFRMRYVTTERYTWKGFNEKIMIQQFYEDVEYEKPEYALIDETYYEKPDFFNNLLQNDYKKIFIGEKYTLYERVS